MKAINFLASLDSSNCTSICTGADLISLCESWADYLGGHEYVDRTYGIDNTVGGQLFTWEDRLERTWNESPNHIPAGLHHDLADNGEGPQACNQDNSGCTTINDNIDGFTIQEMFSCLTVEVQSPEDYQDCLEQNHLNNTGNSLADFNALFNSY